MSSRTVAATLVMAGVLGACAPTGATPPQVETTRIGARSGTEASAPQVPASSDEAGRDGLESNEGQATGGPGEPEPDEGSVPSSEPTARTPVDDLGGVGANGRAYLRGDRSRTVIEVDVQEGASVDDDAIAHLRDTLARVSDRDGIVLAGGETFASDRRDWTRDDLRAAAEDHRDHYSDDTTTVLYVLVVRGGFIQDGERTDAIGVAHNGSEMALFPDRWSDLAGSLTGSSRQVARAVAVHELGHLLGLVNLTFTSEIDHEDPEHPGHSSNRESAMYWAVETTLIGQVFGGPPPDTFDEADLADLAGLRDGRY